MNWWSEKDPTPLQLKLFPNERNVEIPALLNAVHLHKPETLLDVGCHGSAQYYSKDLSEILKYDGIDFVLDDAVAEHCDYIVGDVLNHTKKYDMVTCVSVLEHVGIKEIPIANAICDQIYFVDHLISLTKKHLFLTFPYGKYGVFPDQYTNIFELTYKCILKAYLREFDCVSQFWYCRLPLKGNWEMISKETADTIPLDRSVGVQCVCLLRATRKV